MTLFRYLDSSRLNHIEMGKGLGNFFHYRYRTMEKTREVLGSVCEKEQNRVAGAVYRDTLVGYVTIIRPGEGTCWYDLNRSIAEKHVNADNPVILELGSIEVSTSWRGKGVGKSMLSFIFDDTELEEKIVFTREYSWHWDLKSTRLSSYQYRGMLLRLFQPFGFRYYHTDDAEICYSGESMFLARTGRRVTSEIAMEFYRSVSGSGMGGWGWG